tara:strand:+ start:1637 stop:1897 length:261 start_codon:yes stop_codon:yes gene_type:complete
MRAISYYIVVDDIKEKPAKIAGLDLTEKLTKDEARYKKAKVISVGNLVEGIKNKGIIYYDGHAGHNISYDDKIYKVIRMQDVVLVE